MNLLVLGAGKTGSLVAELGRERGHNVRSLRSSGNAAAAALTHDALCDVDVVVDFTTPAAVLPNIAVCLREKKNMVVGTTGWHAQLANIRDQVQQAGTGFVYTANFSVGVNVFMHIAQTAGEALQHGYAARIVERHHVQKKDAPSGTAIALRARMQPGLASGANHKDKIEITSIREGDAVGQHVIFLDSPEDTMMLVHDAKSRRGYALGAIQAAEWIRGKTGFYEFAEIIASLRP
jgi:4-hydroxy-tetrahydrodipicolinate reductase